MSLREIQSNRALRCECIAKTDRCPLDGVRAIETANRNSPGRNVIQVSKLPGGSFQKGPGISGTVENGVMNASIDVSTY